MEKPKQSTALAEALGGTEVQRGVKLGIVAAGVELFLLFGGSALLNGQSATFDPDRGQIAPLVVDLLSGVLALAVGVVLAFYAGLSAPEAKGDTPGRAGLLAGAITMLLYWIGQSIFVFVDGARSPAGLALGSYLQNRLITGIGFFVIGGLLGWWGSRASARRARSILAPPTTSMLTLLGSSSAQAGSPSKASKPDLSSQAMDIGDEDQAVIADEDTEEEEGAMSREREQNAASWEDADC